MALSGKPTGKPTGNPTGAVRAKARRPGLAAAHRGQAAVSAQAIAWLVLVFGFALPLVHVAASPRSGPWGPPPGSRCPLGPRAGWVVLVLFLGPLGWLLYLRARARRKRA